jgi:hypothetical protein
VNCNHGDAVTSRFDSRARRPRGLEGAQLGGHVGPRGQQRAQHPHGLVVVLEAIGVVDAHRWHGVPAPHDRLIEAPWLANSGHSASISISYLRAQQKEKARSHAWCSTHHVCGAARHRSKFVSVDDKATASTEVPPTHYTRITRYRTATVSTVCLLLCALSSRDERGQAAAMVGW